MCVCVLFGLGVLGFRVQVLRGEDLGLNFVWREPLSLKPRRAQSS